jgi:hypothetical protein
LNVVVVLQRGGLRRENVLDNILQVYLSDYWLLAETEFLVADAVTREQIVFNDSEHGVTELFDKLWTNL